MTPDNFKKFQKRAIQLCEDYETTTPESDDMTMIWFTPQQLMKYTEYCEKQFSINHSKTEKDASN